MDKDFVAQTSVVIDAPAAKVWKGLTDPDLVSEYLHGTNLSTNWKVGSPITWSGEWKGQAYEDLGEVLEFEPEKRFSTTHWSPLSGSEDKPENYHTVTYELTAADGRTRVTLKQSNNASQKEADQMAENSWLPVLQKLKEVVEKS